jgi:hypothetical protein
VRSRARNPAKVRVDGERWQSVGTPRRIHSLCKTGLSYRDGTRLIRRTT